MLRRSRCAGRSRGRSREPIAWRHPWLYELYFRASPLAAALRSRELATVARELRIAAQPEDVVLEIGSGPGTYTRLAARLSRRIVAVDSSAEMVSRLRRLCAEEGVANVDPRWTRAPEGLPAGPFDGCMAIGVLDYVAHLPSTFAAVHESLRPGGWFIFTVPLAGFPPRPSAALQGTLVRRCHGRRPEQVLNEAVAAGFDVQAMRSAGVRVARTLAVRARRRALSPSLPTPLAEGATR